MKIPECKSKYGHFWAGYMGTDEYQRCSWCGHITDYKRLREYRRETSKKNRDKTHNGIDDSGMVKEENEASHRD